MMNNERLGIITIFCCSTFIIHHSSFARVEVYPKPLGPLFLPPRRFLFRRVLTHVQQRSHRLVCLVDAGGRSSAHRERGHLRRDKFCKKHEWPQGFGISRRGYARGMRGVFGNGVGVEFLGNLVRRYTVYMVYRVYRKKCAFETKIHSCMPCIPYE